MIFKITGWATLIVAAMLFLHFTPAYAGDDAKFGKIPDDQWNIGAPQKYPEANAVILFSHGRMVVDIGKIDIYYHVRMKILTPAGIDDIGDIEITYDDDMEKLKGFEAETITPDGTKHKVKGDAVFEKKAGHYKTRTFSFPALEVGSIVEYKYEIIKEHGYRFLKPWYFQNRFYTYESRFSVELGQGFNYKVAYQNVPFDARKPVEEKRPDINRVKDHLSIMVYTWTINDILPIRQEPYMSCVRDYQMAIRFQLESYQDAYNNVSYFQSWKEVGKQFDEFLDDYCNREKEVRQLAEQLTAGISEPRAKARALFDYVTTEYKTSGDTQGKWFIHDKMSKMMEEKYESAEAKNVLLAKLLTAAGITASPVLVSTRDNARFDPQYPSVRWFNYLIVFAQFDDGWEFLDTSSRYAIFGVLPPKCLTDGGFLIDGENSDLVRIAVKDIDSYRSDYNRLYIDDQGAVVCSTLSRFGGYDASSYIARYDANTPEEFADSYYLDRLDGNCTLDTCCLVTDSTAQFAVSLDFTSSDLAERLDNNLLVKPLQFSFNKDPFKSDDRHFPVDFNYPFVYRSITELHVAPEKLADLIPPENLTKSFQGITFTRQGHRTDSTVIVEVELRVKQPLIEPQWYGPLREFFDSVALSTEDVITAVLKTGGDDKQTGGL